MGAELSMMMGVNHDEWLDRQLRDAAPYIDDAGFTAGVLKKLPPPRSHREWFRAIIMMGITLLASTIAYYLSDGGHIIAVAMERIAILPLMCLLSANGIAMRIIKGETHGKANLV